MAPNCGFFFSFSWNELKETGFKMSGRKLSEADNYDKFFNNKSLVTYIFLCLPEENAFQR